MYISIILLIGTYFRPGKKRDTYAVEKKPRVCTSPTSQLTPAIAIQIGTIEERKRDMQWEGNPDRGIRTLLRYLFSATEWGR
jgi:hypothetical protein